MALFGRPSKRDEQRAIEYRDWLQTRHPFAIASFILGVISIIEFGVLLVFGIAGIVLGALALVQLRAGTAVAPKIHGHRLAWTGIALSAVSLVLAAIVYTLPPAAASP